MLFAHLGVPLTFKMFPFPSLSSFSRCDLDEKVPVMPFRACEALNPPFFKKQPEELSVHPFLPSLTPLDLSAYSALASNAVEHWQLSLYIGCIVSCRYGTIWLLFIIRHLNIRLFLKNKSFLRQPRAVSEFFPFSWRLTTLILTNVRAF